MTFSPRDRRKRIFKKSRPLIRAFDPKDNGILWAAHKHNAFGLSQDLGQPEFIAALAKSYAHYPLVWIVEDDCRQFKSGRGPIALVGVKTDGWAYEPFPVFFPWARKRNVLRAAVNFFHMMWSKKEVGVCIVKTTDQERFLSHMKKYGVLYQRGRVPNGTPNGDLWIFSISGKK